LQFDPKSLAGLDFVSRGVGKGPVFSKGRFRTFRVQTALGASAAARRNQAPASTVSGSGSAPHAWLASSISHPSRATLRVPGRGHERELQRVRARLLEHSSGPARRASELRSVPRRPAPGERSCSAPKSLRGDSLGPGPRPWRPNARGLPGSRRPLRSTVRGSGRGAAGHMIGVDSDAQVN